MEPTEYARLLRRRWRLLLAAVVVSGVVAWITTPANPSNKQVTFEATHVLLRDDSSVTPPPALAQLALFVKTGDVPARVAKRIGFDGSPGVLAKRIKAKPDEPSGSLEITASAPTRDQAADLANAFAEETLAFFGEQAQKAQGDAIQKANDEVTRLQGEVADIEAQIDDATDAGEPVGVLNAQRDAKIRQYALALDQQTQVLSQPPPTVGYVTLASATPELAQAANGGFETPRSRTARVGLALLLGLILGVAAVLIAERLDPRIHTRENAEEAFGLPVVAEVPRTERVGRGGNPPSLSATDPLSAVSEAYRRLRSAVILTPLSRLGQSHDDGQERPSTDEPQVVLVTSPTPTEGKTTTVANLATTFAETGRSVLILGCDFRRPEIHRYFGASATPGLSDVLTGGRQLEEVIQGTPVNGVYLAPDGGGLRHLGDLAADGPRLIARARQLADIVIIDTAPILATNDASEMIHSVDAVVVVCRSGSTTTEAARRTRTLLERLSTPVVGVTLVGVPDTEASYSGYYTSTTPTQPRVNISLRRTIKGPEMDERLAPWRVTNPDPTSTGEERTS
jgi:capsular exopolysaccharide synthesis family protein